MRRRIALFTTPSRVTARLIPALQAHVGDIVVIVARGRPIELRLKLRARARSAPEWSPRAQLRRAGVDPPLIAGRVAADPQALIAALTAVRVDLAVSAIYPRKIPAAILDSFPDGAVNLHPARLPGRPGPDAVNTLVAEDAWREAGAVTLHVMDAGLDTGPVIARATLPAEAWEDLQAYQAALGGAVEALAGAPLAAWLSGRARAVIQDPAAPRRWSSPMRQPVPVTADWSFARLDRTWRFVGRGAGLSVEVDGAARRLPGCPVRLSGPTGAPPSWDGRRLAFDVADARALSAQPGWLAGPREKAARRLAWLGRLPTPPVAIDYAESDATIAGRSDAAPVPSR